jgi:hypothetical protein
MVAEAIDKHKPTQEQILIKLTRVEYNPTDYQPEGLVPAVAHWAAEAFHFPQPDITAQYDKVRRKYVFSFEQEIGVRA